MTIKITRLLFNNNARKVQAVIAVVFALTMIILWLLIVIPIKLDGHNINEIYELNKGLFWSIGIIIGITYSVLIFISSLISMELKDCSENNQDLIRENKEITNEILERQKEYLEGQKGISDLIMENSKNDIERMQLISQQNVKIEKALNKIDANERKFNKRLDTQDQKIKNSLDIDKRLVNLELFVEILKKMLGLEKEINKEMQEALIRIKKTGKQT